MSSSFRSSTSVRSSALGASALALVMGVLGDPASASDNYMQPLLQVSGEYHTNRGLEVNSDQAEDLMGYQLDAGLVFGIRTPAAETQIRPRVSFERYTQNSRLDNDAQALDIVSNWRSPLSKLALIGKYTREDTFSTELIEPGFDPLDPTDPTVLNPGRLTIDNVMTRGQVRGDYSHRYTERTGFGFNALAETVQFEHQIPGDRIDYDYGRVGARFEHDMTERMQMRIGPYYARYKAKDDSYTSDGVGAQIGFGWRLSQTFTVDLNVLGEQDSIDRVDVVEVPIVVGVPPFEVVVGTQLVETKVSEKSTQFGGTFGVQHEGPITRLRLELGHTVAPSVRGSNVEADVVRGEYDRQLSPRLGLNAAVRYVRDNKVRRVSTTPDDRQYATASLSLQWQMTPRWYVNGGLQEIWQDYQSDPSSASDHTAFVGFGYVGLGAQK